MTVEGEDVGSEATAANAVPLDGYAMHLRASELALVANGMLELEWFTAATPRALPAALRRLPAVDRPPAWELAVRHFGRRKPVVQAAAEIGMDVIHARDLLDSLARALGARSQPLG